MISLTRASAAAAAHRHAPSRPTRKGKTIVDTFGLKILLLVVMIDKASHTQPHRYPFHSPVTQTTQSATIQTKCGTGFIFLVLTGPLLALAYLIAQQMGEGEAALFNTFR